MTIEGLAVIFLCGLGLLTAIMAGLEKSSAKKYERGFYHDSALLSRDIFLFATLVCFTTAILIPVLGTAS